MKMNEEKVLITTSMPKWFKVFNALALTLILSCSSYIVVNKIGDSHNTTSGAGDIWWLDAPEIAESYQSLIDKKETH